MTDIQVWTLVFIAGVVLYMIGALLPHRLASILGAVTAVVGGIGYFIQALQ